MTGERWALAAVILGSAIFAGVGCRTDTPTPRPTVPVPNAPGSDTSPPAAGLPPTTLPAVARRPIVLATIPTIDPLLTSDPFGLAFPVRGATRPADPSALATQPATAQRPPMVPAFPRTNPARPPKDLKALIDVINDQREPIASRVAAMESLKRFGPDAVSAVPTLTSQLIEDNPALTRPAQYALQAIGPAVVAPLLEQCRLTNQSRHVELMAPFIRVYPDEAKKHVPALLERIKAEVKDDRMDSLRALEAIGPLLDAAAVDAITQYLGEDYAPVRHAAYRVISAAVPVGARKPYEMALLLRDPYPEYPGQAMQEFLGGKLELNDALRPVVAKGLLPLVGKSDFSTKSKIVQALIKVKGPAELAVPAVVDAYRQWRDFATPDRPYNPRELDLGDQLLREIAGFGEAGAVATPALLSLLGEREETNAIVQHLVTGFGPAAAEKVVEALRDMDTPKRIRCQKILSDFYPCPPAAVNALTGMMLSDENEDVRKGAAEALGNCAPRPTAAWASLVQAARDPNAGVRRAALRSLMIIGPAAPAGGPAIDAAALQKFLDNDADPEARFAAARLLATRGQAGGSAAPALVRMTGNDLGPLRRAAADALVAVDPAGDKLGPAMIDAALQSDAETATLLASHLRGMPGREKMLDRLNQAADRDGTRDVRHAATQAAEKLR